MNIRPMPFIMVLGSSLILLFQNCSGFHGNQKSSSDSKVVGQGISTGFVMAVPDGAGQAVPLSMKTGSSLIGASVIYPSVDSQPYLVYSASILNSILAMGGWFHKEDIGPDQLYISQQLTTGWGPLSQLKWTNPQSQDGKIFGYHVNDPNLISIGSKTYMFYTVLGNRYANATNLTRFNWIGYASSENGGATWTDHGVLIGQYNGLDWTGAWSPSAIIVDDEIWIYYHTGSAACPNLNCEGEVLAPRVLRSRIKIDSFKVVQTDSLKDLQGANLVYANVDVKLAFGAYHLLANATDFKSIVLLISEDGINFYRYDGAQGIIINGGPNNVITPTQQNLSSTKMKLTFSFGSKDDLTDLSLNTWEMNFETDPSSRELATAIKINDQNTPQNKSIEAEDATALAVAQSAESGHSVVIAWAEAVALAIEQGLTQPPVDPAVEAAAKAKAEAEAKAAAEAAAIEAQKQVVAKAMYEAGKAFVDAFGTLQYVKSLGFTDPTVLKPYRDVCLAAQENATNWGVAVNLWSCLN